MFLFMLSTGACGISKMTYKCDKFDAPTFRRHSATGHFEIVDGMLNLIAYGRSSLLSAEVRTMAFVSGFLMSEVCKS